MGITVRAPSKYVNINIFNGSLSYLSLKYIASIMATAGVIAVMNNLVFKISPPIILLNILFGRYQIIILEILVNFSN